MCDVARGHLLERPPVPVGLLSPLAPGVLAPCSGVSRCALLRLGPAEPLGEAERADPEPEVDRHGQAGSHRKPLLSSQMMASPFPATPLMPASARGQNSPGS